MLVGKVFAALARERPWARLRSQGKTGWGVHGGARGNAAMGLAARRCVPACPGACGRGAVRRLAAGSFARQ